MNVATLGRVFLTLLVTLMIAILPIGIWLTVKSADYIRVIAYTYNQATGDVTMERNLLQGDVMVRTYIAITGADGRSCFYEGERVFEAFDAKGRPTTQEVFRASPKLRPCLNSRPYTVVGRYYVKAFGGLMLLKPTFYFEPKRDEAVTKGEKGDTGPAGPSGPAGPQGAPG